jgi:hypothetical protein
MVSNGPESAGRIPPGKCLGLGHLVRREGLEPPPADFVRPGSWTVVTSRLGLNVCRCWCRRRLIVTGRYPRGAGVVEADREPSC